MSCLFSILCLCKMLGFIMAQSDRQLRTTCKKTLKHSKKQRSPNLGVQPSIQPNFRVVGPPPSSLVPWGHLNSGPTLGWSKRGEEKEGLAGKRVTCCCKRTRERISKPPRAVSGELVQIGVAVPVVSLLCMLLEGDTAWQERWHLPRLSALGWQMTDVKWGELHLSIRCLLHLDSPQYQNEKLEPDTNLCPFLCP